MTSTRLVAPGLYALTAITGSEDDETVLTFCANDHACWNQGGDTDEDWIVVANDILPGVGEIVESPVGPAGTLLLTIDADVDMFDAVATNTPFGPLSLSRHYALLPCSSTETNWDPDPQYSMHWLVLDLKDETPLSIDGGRIVIGGETVDVASGPDLLLDGSEVIRVGTELHGILLEDRTDLLVDDGVLVCVRLTTGQLARIEAIDTDEARAAAADLRRDIEEWPEGRCGSVYGVHFDPKPDLAKAA